MKEKPCVLAMIPARSGSKGVSDKNVRPIAGKPLIAYSIDQAKQSKYVDRIIVSTDSKSYAKIAREYGAETPFLRPIEISNDDSTDLEAFTHALNWLRDNEDYSPDICVQLRPTSPIRNVQDIDKAVKMLIVDSSIDSVRSVSSPEKTPYKMWFMDEDGFLKPVINTAIKEAYNLPRQSLPETYVQNACIDVMRTSVILEKKSMTGDKIIGLLMDEYYDIDSEEHFNYTEKKIVKDKDRSVKRTFCFDIDGVIATFIPDLDYSKAGPMKKNIHVVNKLYSKGHKIILFTARGSLSGIGWEKTTKKQMKDWGVKYHELLFKKPAADYYIDDKNASIKQIKHLYLED